VKEIEQEIIQKKQFDRFVQDYDHLKGPNQNDIDRFIAEIKTLERFSLDSKRFYILFDFSKFYATYISENVAKEGGYPVKYIINQGLYFLFQRIHWKQLTSVYKVYKWGKKFQKMVGIHIPRNTYEIWYCGLKLKDKWGRWRTVILKEKLLATTQDNKPLLAFLEAEEITNIYKTDVCWYRASCFFEETRITRAYFTNGAKKEYDDILSLREIEILKLAAQQKSNQEISELLNISKNTVERHRKNMIARVGVTDITALIRIAQMVKII